MPEWAAGLSARRDRKNDVDMMSNCQPSLRAIASAFGTLGDSMKPNRSVTLEKVGADLLHPHPLGRVDPRRRRGLDGENDVLLVQHLVVLQAVHQRGRRARRDRWSGTRRCRSTRCGGRFSSIATRSASGNSSLRDFSNSSRLPRRHVYISSITSRRARAAPSRLRTPSAGWPRGRSGRGTGTARSARRPRAATTSRPSRSRQSPSSR